MFKNTDLNICNFAAVQTRKKIDYILINVYFITAELE